MGLEWDAAMVNWPKPAVAVWDGTGGNQGFLDGMGDNLSETLRPSEVTRALCKIGRTDVDWLDAVFADYNAALGYPPRFSDVQMAGLPEGGLTPDIRRATRHPAMQAREWLYRTMPPLRQMRRKLRRYL